MRWRLKSILSLCFSVAMVVTAMGQFTGGSYSTGIAGGTASSTSYTTEFSTGVAGGNIVGEDFGLFLGLASLNLESGVVTVVSSLDGTTISDEVEGVLLRISESGNYDTLDVVTNPTGDFSFNPVFVGDYLVSVDSDQEKYVATYYGDSEIWELAETLTLEGDSAIQVEMVAKPPDRSESTGQGSVSGTITEDFEAEDGRIAARRRAARRKCGLRRKTGGGRTSEDGFELIAYGETNDNGEFEYGFLPEGTYRFFVEYPGIPLDESSFVEFEIGVAGVSDDSFVLAAVVTETGIVIDLILGLTSEFFTDFNIYPNPTTNYLNISYDEIKADKLGMELIDINGKVMLQQEDIRTEDQSFQINLSPFSSGQYLLRFINPLAKDREVLTFRIVKK